MDIRGSPSVSAQSVESPGVAETTVGALTRVAIGLLMASSSKARCVCFHSKLCFILPSKEHASQVMIQSCSGPDLGAIAM